MKHISWLLLILLLVACQPQGQVQAPINNVYLLDGEQLIALPQGNYTPESLAVQAGLPVSSADQFYFNGNRIPADFSLPANTTYTVQIRRAVNVTIITPNGEQTIQSAAFTVGQALSDTGLVLHATDFISPPPETPLNTPLTITYRPARDITISVDGTDLTVKTAAATVGIALAEAGIPLIGLDESIPAESEKIPADGLVKVIRVQETVILQQEAIPFESQFIASAELELDTQNLLQVGEPGLAISRVRVRTENGEETSRTQESQTVVRPPVDRIIGYGTQVNIKTLAVPGGEIQYWRAIRMYATWYSPCNSGISGCSYGTASGLPVKHGVVAMTRQHYNAMSGQRLYIPIYGFAVIADVGGGMPDGRLWIDLGYSDDEPAHLSGWVTVYFLAPVPNSIIYVME